MSTLQPLLVRARLQTGIATANSWGIALDSLLAAQLWSRRKQALRAAGHPTTTLHDTTDPEELELPLARCTLPTHTDLWHWAATTAYPENQPTDLPPDVHTWNARLDHRAAEHLTATLPKTVSDRQGRYRARRMPLLVTICTAVTWHCIGDPTAIKDLLTEIPSIGKKRTHGEGHVLAWEVHTRPDLEAWTAAHLHPDGTLGRTTPDDCLTGQPPIPDGGVGTAGLRPPYMHRARQHTLHLPRSLDHDPTHGEQAAS